MKHVEMDNSVLMSVCLWSCDYWILKCRYWKILQLVKHKKKAVFPELFKWVWMSFTAYFNCKFQLCISI